MLRSYIRYWLIVDSCELKRLFDEFTRSAGLQIASVAFIRINMDLQLEALIDTHQQSVERDAARPANLELHRLPGLDPIKRRVIRGHVRVPQRPDHTLGHLKESGRPHQHAAQRPLDVAGYAQRQIEPERDAVRV